MNRLLLVFVLALAALVGLGFYIGWFHVLWNADGATNITLTVDTDKIHEDANKAQQRMHDLGHPAKEKADGAHEKAKGQAAPPARPPPDDE